MQTEVDIEIKQIGTRNPLGKVRVAVADRIIGALLAENVELAKKELKSKSLDNYPNLKSIFHKYLGE